MAESVVWCGFVGFILVGAIVVPLMTPKCTSQHGFGVVFPEFDATSVGERGHVESLNDTKIQRRSNICTHIAPSVVIVYLITFDTEMLGLLWVQMVCLQNGMMVRYC